ncbi:MAG: NADH-quinone oxidoreductase subunit C [Desulfovibrio sp.]|uniref:NADH-quinone oxidoreductase subunit C n=1 Tax=Desulfovibrio sp. TaxID=885 RepID=UPI00135D3DF3|nr:NADH-quinone oxidoreductase subunit C [Desulfovibrio sp.]MTJ93717.1 NADH-quinone oxidoreductase subunit C [Desulfovibrio sp.]
MESLEIARLLREAFPREVLDIREHRGQVAVLLRHERILDVLVYARQQLGLMHLRSLCGVDNSRRHEQGLGAFEVVYNLYSVTQRVALRLRAQLEDPEAGIDSAVPLWPVANWLEREVFDLMGIHFKGHPDLRRILLPDDWQGHPLRKTYPVRIPLRGVPEWSGLTELRERAKEADALSWQGGDEA